ncbi:DMT family transporter [Alphaproteobacteria bacterium]|jgi:drug/metabolite transporter (DMT)-like permease|nr:DMT family transporter [Alphaproteobacteria bacterium]MDB2388237.1 DMT family transporter [Alphaproteobacteria bacterium]MDB2583809.1 DMT family transporter [Alphaproteobacteria bacterium]
MNKENNYKVFFTPPVLAVFFMIFSGFFATTMHCLIRFATEDHHPFEVAFFRTIFVLIIFLPLVARNGISSLKSNNIKLQTFRAIVGSVAMLCMFYGLSITELAKATALMFTVPIFATILAILFLKEIVGIRRWLAMIVGFTGAVIVLRPDVELGFGPLLILCASLMWSSSMLMAKTLTKTDSISSITFWQAAGLIPATFILAVPVWQWPNLSQLFMFLMIAIAGTLVHWFLNEALKRAEISALLPLDYLRLIWSVSMGFIFFNELPHAGLWFGAALILGASTYIGIRQVQKKKEDLNTNSNISI